jgi:hypothetical protein
MKKKTQPASQPPCVCQSVSQSILLLYPSVASVKILVGGPEEAAPALRVDREGGREAKHRARQVRRLWINWVG